MWRTHNTGVENRITVYLRKTYKPVTEPRQITAVAAQQEIKASHRQFNEEMETSQQQFNKKLKMVECPLQEGHSGYKYGLPFCTAKSL